MQRTLLVGILSLAAIADRACAEDVSPAADVHTAVSPPWRLPPVESARPPQEVLPAVAEEVAPSPVEATGCEAAAVECAEEPEPPPKIWNGSFELGLSGTSGNSETLNVRFGFDGKLKTRHDVTKLDFDYHRNYSEASETAHRALLDWRYEWLFKDTPWTWFVHGTVDYDEFKAFDLRLAGDSGVGYQFINTDATSLLGRFGAGVSREIGGREKHAVPELVFGTEFDHQLTKRQKLSFLAEYMPDVREFTDFRLKSKMGWEVLLDEEMNLSLKLNVIDRYDSTPGGKKPNDLDYSVVLLWSF